MAVVSETNIANQALLLLGANTITDIDGTQPNAVVMELFFDDARDALLRKYIWKFAIKRVQITENVTAPVFGRARAFDLPADYLAPLPPYPEDDHMRLDWIVENGQIVSDESSPLDFRYIAKITDPLEMNVHFRQALSARLAILAAEKLTQSNSKIQNVSAIFDSAITEARMSNAIEQVNHQPPLDTWVTVREDSRDNTKSWH